MPENVAAIASNFPGIETSELVTLAVGGYQEGRGARDTTFAVLSELKRRGAMTSYNRVKSILTPDDMLFFGNLLNPSGP